MPAYKDKAKGTWYASFYYEDWTGKKVKKMKRGFPTKREALEWERTFLQQQTADLEMTFENFVAVYVADMKGRIKENTWGTKEHILYKKLVPYFGKRKMCDIHSKEVIAWQNEMLGYRDKNGKLYYLYSTQSDDAPTMKGSTVYLDPAEVLHIPGLGFDGLVGYSPIAMAKNAIGMAIACEEYGAKFFANGAAPGGVLEHPGTIKDPQRVRESWQSTFGGSGNANKIAVLEEGMKYTPIGISPEQAQFLETRKFQINEIARIFRVPPHMVGDLEKSSFSNIEQQSLEFVKYTLDPWVIRWEQSIQRSLLSKDEKAMYFVKFNLEGLLRGDYQSRMNGYAIGRQNGWMSANDIRELENLDRIPAEDGGDLYLINGNMLPLQNAGAFANINTDNGKEEKSDEEVLELEKQDSDQRGDAGTDPRENPVLKRHDR